MKVVNGGSLFTTNSRVYGVPVYNSSRDGLLKIPMACVCATLARFREWSPQPIPVDWQAVRRR